MDDWHGDEAVLGDFDAYAPPSIAIQHADDDALQRMDEDLEEQMVEQYTGYRPKARPAFQWPKLGNDSDDDEGVKPMKQGVDDEDTEVEAYEGDDDAGMALTVLSAAFKALQTPLQARRLIQESIQKGPGVFGAIVKPDETYPAEEGVDGALTFFAMAAACAPAGLIMKMGPRTLVLAAHGTHVILVDFRPQPAAAQRGGFPVLGGTAPALVMISHNPLEVSVFLKKRYEAISFEAALYTVSPDAQVAAALMVPVPVPPAARKSVSIEGTTPVDSSVAALSLDATQQPQPALKRRSRQNDPDVNQEGKRERTPPLPVSATAPEAALGSPRAAAASITEPEPKRAKTPPLPQATSAVPTTNASLPAKAEKRKSVGTAGVARKPPVATTTPVAAAAAVKKETEPSK